MVICALVACVILSPLMLALLSSVGIFGSIFPSFSPFIAVAVSGLIAVIIAVVLYRFTLNYAKDFLRKAEV
jgi:hypothetical protein